MSIHRSIRIDEELWGQMKAKALEHRFETPSAYLLHIIKEDLKKGSLEQTEERLVSTISTLSRKVQTIGTAQQASFATLWKLLEIIVHAFPVRPGSAAGDQRMHELQVQIAGEVRGKGIYKEIADGNQEIPT